MQGATLAFLLLISATAVAAGYVPYFVLPLDKGATLFAQCSRPTPTGVDGFWKPTASQIAELETALEPFLRSSSQGAPVPQLTHFRRQYVGFIKDGKRYIYGNFYPVELPNGREATDPVVVCDGGASFWGVVYAVESGTFQDLEFNGAA